MNPFEKIFSYQILSRLEETGTLIVTSQERAWLKTMLAHPAAAEAFPEETLAKLNRILHAEVMMDTSHHLIEKAKSKEKHVFHPLLRPVRRYIAAQKGIRISYVVRTGRVHTEHEGFPYQLEYSMIKREWYLLWYHLRQRRLMSTKLSSILSLSEETMPSSQTERIRDQLAQLKHTHKSEIVIEVIRDYNQELSRILYAFSCFEKNVAYDDAHNMYQIQIFLPQDEVEFLLSKIRFLGKRVRVIQGSYVKKRMREAAALALERYKSQ